MEQTKQLVLGLSQMKPQVRGTTLITFKIPTGTDL